MPRRAREIRAMVLTDKTPFQTVERQHRAAPSQEVMVEGSETKKEKTAAQPRRYVTCRNPARARKDAAKAIIAGL